MMKWTDDEKEMLCVRASQLRRNRPNITQAELFQKVQLFLPPERRTCRFEYEDYGWLHVASQRDSLLRLSQKVDAIHEQLEKLLEILRAQTDPHYIPLEYNEAPDGDTRFALNRLGITIEDSVQVDRLVEEIKASDPFAGM